MGKLCVALGLDGLGMMIEQKKKEKKDKTSVGFATTRAETFF